MPEAAPVSDLGKLGLPEVKRVDWSKFAADPQFSLPSNLFLFKKAGAEDWEKRRGIKRFIRPENAKRVLDHLPSDPNDRTHAVLRGDFVLCDLIPALIAARGHCPHLQIATLGLSVDNAQTLAALLDAGQVDRLTLVVSHYFQQVDKTTTWPQVDALLGKASRRRSRLAVTRSHAKVILVPTAAGDHFALEGSANLRSSDNLEQIVITNDAETMAFHARWLETIATQAEDAGK